MLKRSLIGIIRFYQRFLSPLKRSPTCRFVPTCSSYAIEAIRKRGVVVGSVKAFWRLLRCNPLFPGGYDPVDRPARNSDSVLDSRSIGRQGSVDGKWNR